MLIKNLEDKGKEMNKELEIRAGIHLLERAKGHLASGGRVAPYKLIGERLLTLRRDLYDYQEGTANQAQVAIRWAESNKEAEKLWEVIELRAKRKACLESIRAGKEKT